MRETNAKGLFIVRYKRLLAALVVELVAGTQLKQEDSDSSHYYL
jgi:hypothetical protein